MDIKRLIVGTIETNCYIVVSGESAMIIDPGGDAEKIINEFKKLNKQLEYIIFTHYHFDHTDAGVSVQQALGGETMLHIKDKAYIDLKIDKYLHDNDLISLGQEKLKVVNTPGHTEGSFCLFGEGFVFTGDTLFQMGYGRTDLPGGNESAIYNSLNQLKTLIKPGMMVYPGHGNYYQA